MKTYQTCQPASTRAAASRRNPDVTGTRRSRTTGKHSSGDTNTRKARSRDFAQLDLGPIQFKLVDPKNGEGWTSAKAEMVAVQYRRFLTLIRENPTQTIVPTEAIDEFWHYHILDTKKYAADCNEYFGYFVHHFPYLGLRGDDDVKRLAVAFENTKELYQARFGESLLPANGLLSAADCSSSGCGGVVCSAGSCTSEQRPVFKPQMAA